jgi:hypothetical protein
VIKLTKVSTVGKTSPLPLGFDIEAPTLAKMKKTKGDMMISLPDDPKLLDNAGPNALIAVIYSAESGEEAVNYSKHVWDKL